LRRHLPALQIAVPFATASLVVVACGSGGSSTARSAKAIGSTAAASAPAPGTPPPAPGDGGAGASSPTYTATGKYTLAGATAFKANATISASGSDESGVLVIKSATLTLMNSKITTSGNSKSSEESSFYGLNAGVLANTKGKAYISGGSVTTSGSGANGIFAYGAGAVISTADTAITATGGGAHGAMTAGGGAATLAGANISTAGASAAAIATDRGGGTISVSGGTMTTSGYKSPAIYSTGVIKVSGARMSATGAEAAVVEGGNSIAVTDTTLKAARQHGVMLYNSMSGDANAGTGTFTMDGGSLTAAAGPAFYVTNTKAVIALRGGARVSAASGTLVRADNKGTGSGNTGTGAVTLALVHETLTGNLLAEGAGTIAASLQRGTTLTGVIDKAAVTLDSTSTWRVTGNSALTSLSDPSGITGTSITNIIGHGYTVTYNASLVANSKLANKTYALAGGGQLRPA
jgi:hypothetical protein